MITVLLYGHLAKQFGRRHELDILTPAEAIRALCVNYKTFKNAIIQDGQIAYFVRVGKEDRADKEGLHLPVSGNCIKIIPAIGGRGGLGKVLFGAGLIGLSFIPGLQGVTLFGNTTLTGLLGNVGFSMVLGGVSSLLFSPPKQKTSSTERGETKPSYAFSGAVNTVAQGNPVPVFYGGPMRIGSQVISAGLVTENL